VTASPASRPTIELLGSLGVRLGERSVTALGGHRQRVVLTVLALAGRPVRTDELADIVWAGRPPATWPAALRNVVTGLRAALDPLGLGEQRLIGTTDAGYEIRSADVDLIDAPLDRLRAGLAVTDDHPFFVPYRADVSQRLRTALETAARDASSAGDHARAVTIARTVVIEHPLDEGAHRLLIGVLHTAGDRAGVVEAWEACRATLADELGIDPSAETLQTYLDAIGGDRRSAGGVPAVSGVFVERREELDTVRKLVSAPGLVTLTGRGGIGKSRLAAEAARAERSSSTVRWAVVAEVTDDELVAVHLAVSLGADGADPVDALGRLLASWGRTLLVLDGCDDLVAGAALVTTELLARCPQLTVLATSRAPLVVPGEQIVAVPPLRDPAALLRARAIESGVEAVAPGSLQSLAGRSNGLPLAVELIAGQLADIAPADLLDELPDSGVTAILDRSYGTLAGDEAAVFRRLSVLGGSASLGLLRSVACGDDVLPGRLSRVLRDLADRGLVSVDRGGDRWRYLLDDDIRRWVIDRFDITERAATLERALRTVAALLPDDATTPPGPWAQSVTDAGALLRPVLDAGVAGDLPRERLLELAFRLHRYWAGHSVTEGRIWLGRLLDGAAAGPWQARATFAAGYLAYWAGDSIAARALLQEASEQLLTSADPSDLRYVTRSLIFVGGISDDLDDGPEAVAQLRSAVSFAEQVGDPGLELTAVMNIGAVLAERGDPEALDFADRAIAVSRAGGSADQLAMLLATASAIAWQVDALDRSSALARECRQLLAGSRRASAVIADVARAVVAFDGGNLDGANALAAEALDMGRELGVDRELPVLCALLAAVCHRTGDLPGAVAAVREAVRLARSLGYRHPMAWAWEAGSLVVEKDLAAELLAGAGGLRRAGDRPRPGWWDRALQGAVVVPTDADPSELTARLLAGLDGVTTAAG
jgi:predicted ATPase/DNA-binding SARP family transcriptional activator